MKIIIGKNEISEKSNTYFIADIAANHDGNLDKAFELIYEAKKAGADAAKFQHFSAETIVSDKSFSSMKSKLSHQSKWKKSVFQVYKDASLNLDWTPKLYNYCKKIGIHFLTSPYSIDLVDHVDKFVPAYKIGSGDITWLEIIRHISKKKKPVILATGASSMQDVVRAIKTIKKYNSNICIMQCNTNYTASEENFNHINLNVLKSYRKKFKNIILGLSDHTLGHSTVLGAIAIGARIIEKHFTLNNSLTGPDHKFSMNPRTWKDMVLRSRELERSMGLEVKKIELNEKEPAIVQRRSIHANKFLKKNKIITKKDLIFLRPCPKEGIVPYKYKKIIGKKVRRNIQKNEIITLKKIFS